MKIKLSIAILFLMISISGSTAIVANRYEIFVWDVGDSIPDIDVNNKLVN